MARCGGKSAAGGGWTRAAREQEQPTTTRRRENTTPARERKPGPTPSQRIAPPQLRPKRRHCPCFFCPSIPTDGQGENKGRALSVPIFRPHPATMRLHDVAGNR